MKLVLLLFLTSGVLSSSDCGIRLGAGTISRPKRVVGGNRVTSVGKWPWQILLKSKKYWKDGTPVLPLCGGTIVNDRWVLTAAHCVRYNTNGTDVTVKDAVVFAGVTDSESDTIVGSLVDRHAYRMLEAFPHGNYTDAGYEHDIALIKLENPIEFDQAVSAICLPSTEQDIPPDGQAVATGYGESNKRGTNETINDNKLRETIVPIVREDICEVRWKAKAKVTSQEWRKQLIICAGAFGHDAATGDSGGPLIMKSTDGRWFQLGVTASGDPSIEADLIPGIYTDVREYCEWISETTKGEVKCQEDQVTLQDVEIKIRAHRQ